MKTVYIDPVPVRYSGSVPSMSRRGGIRVHPLRDGGIDTERHSHQRPIWRDALGHKYREHVDPKTGFVTSVTGTAESPQAQHGISGGATGTLKLLPVKKSGNVYLDDEGRVIRTLDMGEEPVVARPKNPGGSTTPKTQKRGGTVSARASKRARPAVPGGTGANGRITDEDVQSYIRVVASKRGQTVTVFTPAMMQAGREALKLARKKAELALAKKG